ncbi:MAG TPA: hypothetical protein VK474_11615 [Chthoniobacterales bacterium]|nr:hypothetical protein [Chthoniobacterales bacterium]
MKTKITVTAEHIASGVRYNSRRCPLANAFAAIGCNPLVGAGVVHFCDPDLSPLGRSGLPRTATLFRERFDEGVAVEPLTFEIDIPDGALPSRDPASPSICENLCPSVDKSAEVPA